MAKKQFAISFHIAMTLIVISLLLFPFYYTRQFAWSQSLVSSDGQQQESQTVQADNNLSSSVVSGIGGLEDDRMIATQQLASNSSSYFIFPSQEQLFFPSVNATRQTDLAILSGTWTVENSRAITQSLAELDALSPKMAFVIDRYIPSNETDTKIHLRIYDPGVRSKPSPA
jgi:hypothetical protein